MRRVGAICTFLLGLSSLAAAICIQQVAGRVVDEKDAPISGAQVQFEPGGKSASTDKTGALSVSELADGRYQATIRVSNRSRTIPVTVENGRLNPSTLRLTPPASAPDQVATARVVDKDGAGVADAKVTFGSRLFFLTRGDGRFEFRGPAGEYDVTIEVGGKTVRTKATVAGNKVQPDVLRID